MAECLQTTGGCSCLAERADASILEGKVEECTPGLEGKLTTKPSTGPCPIKTGAFFVIWLNMIVIPILIPDLLS